MLKSMLSQKKKIKRNRNNKVEKTIKKQIREISFLEKFQYEYQMYPQLARIIII